MSPRDDSVGRRHQTLDDAAHADAPPRRVLHKRSNGGVFTMPDHRGGDYSHHEGHTHPSTTSIRNILARVRAKMMTTTTTMAVQRIVQEVRITLKAGHMYCYSGIFFFVKANLWLLAPGPPVERPIHGSPMC